MCDAGPMAQTVCVIVSAADRERLQAIIGDRNQPRKHIERACLVLASAEREPAQRVAAGVGVSRPTVWRWQQRYAEVGVEGLLRELPTPCDAEYGPRDSVRPRPPPAAPPSPAATESLKAPPPRGSRSEDRTLWPWRSLLQEKRAALRPFRHERVACVATRGRC